MNKISEGHGDSALVRVLCMAAVIALPLIQAFRGLDLTDTGFVAANQLFFFDHPEHVAYWFHLWLTNFVGALVLALTGGSLLALKLGAAVIFWLSAWGIARLYREELSASSFWLVIAALTAFDFAGKINVIHYNNLTFLVFVWGAAFLGRSAFTGSWKLSLAAGFLLSLNGFVRLPNILGLGLLVVPVLLILWAGKDKLRWTWAQTGTFAAGAALAVAVGLGLLLVLGQLKIYLDSLGFLGADSASGNSYSLKSILKRTIKDTLGAAAFGASGLLLVVGAHAATRFLKARWLALGLQAAAFLALYLFAGPLIGEHFSKWIYWLPVGIGYWCLAVLFFESRERPQLFLAALLSVSVAFLMGIGSDTGNKVSTYTIPLMGPAVFLAAISLERRLAWFTGISRTLLLCLALLVLPQVTLVYRDAAVPEVVVDHGRAWGVTTTKARWDSLEEVVAQVNRVAPPGSELLAYDSIPLVHFLTGTLPYLNSSWPVFYTHEEISGLLKERSAAGVLPPVLLAKKNARSTTWPIETKAPSRSKDLEAFLAEHRYAVSWENRDFVLLLPGNKGKSD